MNSGLAGIRNIYNHCKSIKEWNVQRRNFVIGDIVLLKTIDVLGNKWLVARVMVTKRNHNGLV